MISVPPGARLVVDPAELEAHFSDRPEAHIYALADLEDPYWSGSSWYRRGDAVVGLVAMPDGAGLAVYAVSTLDPAGSVELLAELAPQLPGGLLITGPSGMSAGLRRHREIVWEGPHLRYHLVDASMIPEHDPIVVTLGAGDLAALETLYGTEPGAAFFMPHMLGDDTFVGVWEHDRLVAAAGTHVVSERQGIAAIGSVYCHPAYRGRGFGRLVSAGAVRCLGGRVQTVGLNVSASNRPARSIYESLGFHEVLRYDEAELA